MCDLRYLERRIETLLKRADELVELAQGDIYGAELRVFQRWSCIMQVVGELSVVYVKLKEGV